jgi:CBS domain-containing protein
MNVGDLCQREVLTVSRSSDVIKAAQLMRQGHVGYLVVVEPGEVERQRPVGVLTDRDIITEVLATGRDPARVHVGDIMTQPPITVRESESADKALQEMRRVEVHRLPVVGPHDELVGVVALDDVLSVVASTLQSLARSIRNDRWIEGKPRL